MAINPITGQEEDVDPVTGLPVASAPAAPAAPAVPDVRDYLMKKYGLSDKYSDENRQKLVDEAAQKASGPDIAAGLAAFGAGISGGNAMAAGKAVLDKQAADRNKPLDEFDKGRKRELENFDQERKFTGAQREDEKYAKDQELVKREADPASEESSLAQQLAKKMLPSKDFSGMSAQQINKMLPSLTKVYDIEQKKLDRAEARTERRFQQGIKMDEKMEALKTPYGLAHTADDAKKLKEAHESKQNFDSKIQEMIDLRKKYGGELFNREAVGRGKQLSKDLLLEYKNMAKLGVLSQSDENIINAIIPEDPLAFQAASVVGQDPILHKLEAFKKDSDKDFATRVSTRTRAGQDSVSTKAAAPANPQEVKRKDPKTGKIAVFDAQTKKFLRYE